MKEDWSIREYKEGDRQKINDLFNFIFKTSRTEKDWDWEFKKNFDGSKLLVVVAKERIIGHLGGLHRFIKIGEKTVLASLEVDGMTHPDYTHRGIFVAIGNRLLSELSEEGINIVIGFPNENAIPGHRKMGCIELFTPHVLIRPLNFKNLSKKLTTNRFFGSVCESLGNFAFNTIYKKKKVNIEEDMNISEVTNFDDRYDRFWKEICLSHSIILKRDSKYMNWRYIECPKNDYRIFVAEKDKRILAMIVVTVIDAFELKSGTIVEFLALPEYKNAALGTLQKGMDYLEKLRVDIISCLIPKWSEYNAIFRRCGFVTCPKRLNQKEWPFIIYPISKDINIEMVKNPLNWYITWGDTDVA